jgi:hypothetical protein
MTSIARVVGLDLRSLRPSAKVVVWVALAVAIVFSLTNRQPFLVIQLAGLLVAMLAPQYLFNNDERGRLDTLYTALGIPRRTVVAGRYATLTSLAVAGVAVGIILTVILAAIFSTRLNWGSMAALALATIAAAGLILAVQAPFYFSLGFTRARPVGFVALLALAIPAYFLGIVAPDTGTWRFGGTSLTGPLLILVPLGGLIAVAALGILSYSIAARRYARRDL